MPILPTNYITPRQTNPAIHLIQEVKSRLLTKNNIHVNVTQITIINSSKQHLILLNQNLRIINHQ